MVWTTTIEWYIWVLLDISCTHSGFYNAWRWFYLVEFLRRSLQTTESVSCYAFVLDCLFVGDERSSLATSLQHEVCNLEWFSRWRRGGVDATMPTASHQRSDPSQSCDSGVALHLSLICPLVLDH
jgi:hypothetical protein